MTLMTVNVNTVFTCLGTVEEVPLRLTATTPMSVIVREMQKPDSGLEIRDRNWLKITIPNAFIGNFICG